MANAQNYEAAARTWQRADLGPLHMALRANTIPSPFSEKGKAFEYLVIRAFEVDGLDVRWPFELRDPAVTATSSEQVDGVVYLDGMPFLLESKLHAKPIDIEPLTKLRYRLESRPPHTMGLVISDEGFTSPAATFARFFVPMNIMLWSGQDLQDVLSTPGASMRDALRTKWRAMVEDRKPDQSAVVP